VFDPSAEWTVHALDFQSLSKNTPFEGRKLKGKVVHTFYGGRHTVREGRVIEEALV
jgi:dihydroorotase